MSMIVDITKEFLKTTSAVSDSGEGALRSVNFISKFIAGVNISDLTFDDCDFQSTVFKNCVFEGIFFESCNFSDSVILNCVFREVQFYWCDLYSAYILQSSFDNCVLKGGNAFRSILPVLSPSGLSIKPDNLGGTTDVTEARFLDT